MANECCSTGGVGFVETSDDVCYFASNIDMRNRSDRVLRQPLARDALKLKAILN